MILQQRIGEWTTSAIHDTVAAIASQPAYSVPLRRSLFGRIFTWVLERLGALFELARGSHDIRIAVIIGVVLVLLAVVGRVVVAKQIDIIGHRAEFGADFGVGHRRDFWKLASELAANGDHVAASHALYAAVIDGLTRSGSIVFHSSKTSGDYARELARRGATNAKQFRAFARTFDSVVYGASTVSAADYARLADMARELAATRVAA